MINRLIIVRHFLHQTTLSLNLVFVKQSLKHWHRNYRPSLCAGYSTDYFQALILYKLYLSLMLYIPAFEKGHSMHALSIVFVFVFRSIFPLFPKTLPSRRCFDGYLVSIKLIVGDSETDWLKRLTLGWSWVELSWLSWGVCWSLLCKYTSTSYQVVFSFVEPKRGIYAVADVTWPDKPTAVSFNALKTQFECQISSLISPL